jgi:putative addiction module antidote
MNKPLKSLKLIPIGNSTGLILPKDALARLGLSQGDAVSLSVTDEGLVLRPHDPEFERQMEVAREVMERRRKALRELAK